MLPLIVRGVTPARDARGRAAWKDHFVHDEWKPAPLPMSQFREIDEGIERRQWPGE
ncbi:MAG: hypothetical protein M3018_02580 [Actinomycetota bacterium]|nr:hypothetical protein [Actinomycetota bacterium]